MIRRYLDCPPRERLRRIAVAAVVAGVISVPAVVTFTMLVSGNV